MFSQNFSLNRKTVFVFLFKKENNLGKIFLTKMLEEFKLRALENNGFENRQKTITIAFFGTFGVL